MNITNPKDITARVVKDYISDMKRVESDEPLADSTRYAVQSAIKSFLRYLYENDYIDTEIGSKLKRIKIKKKESPYLSPDQYYHFIMTVKKQSTLFYRERDVALMNLLIKSGIRRSELVNLNISDIDLVQSKIWIKRKGGNEGYLPLLAELSRDLEKYILTLNTNADAPLFTSKLNNRLSAASVWHLVKVYAKKAGLSPKITVHSLRHGFATKLLHDGVSISVIQKLMGHINPTTTFRYLHVTDSDIRNELNEKVMFSERR
jgi:site-specific recombinase XerD